MSRFRPTDCKDVGDKERRVYTHPAIDCNGREYKDIMALFYGGFSSGVCCNKVLFPGWPSRGASIRRGVVLLLFPGWLWLDCGPLAVDCNGREYRDIMALFYGSRNASSHPTSSLDAGTCVPLPLMSSPSLVRPLARLA